MITVKKKPALKTNVKFFINILICKALITYSIPPRISLVVISGPLVGLGEASVNPHKIAAVWTGVFHVL